MDHDGQLKDEGRMASQGRVDGIDLCDNGALPAQNLNLNEANILAQTQSLPQSEYEEEGKCSLFQKSSFNNNGREEEEEEAAEQGKKGHTGSRREEDEDADAVMEEDEESEESSSLIRCQSPDTPMTDSSYSETGSLLETSCPFSPGTSPEPTSPVIPVVSPVELSQCGSDVDSYTESGTSTTGAISCKHGPTFTTGPMDLPPQTENLAPSSSTVGSPCIPEATERITTNTEPSTVSLTPPTEPIVNPGPTRTQGSTSSCTGAVDSTELPTFTTASTSTAIDFISTTGPVSSHLDRINPTPVTTCSSISSCITGPITTPALLESLQQLAQKGDDTHLPQYLHQVAEAFVLQEDYQRALWCIQLERVYHQRVLDNLNALQEQWESQCERTSSDLATKQLDPLKVICQTHTGPMTRDAECASLDFLIPKSAEGAAVPSCTSANQMEGGMEQRVEDSTCAFMPSIDLTEKLNSPEISEKEEEEDPGSLDGSQLSNKQTDDGERGEAEEGVGRTISVMGNELHPSTAGRMDQSEPAEQQGQDLDPGPEKEAKPGKERDVEEAEGGLEMEEEGDEEEEERKQGERDSLFCQEALRVETLVSGADVEEQLLQEDAKAQQKLHEETPLCQKTQEAYLTHYTNVEQQEQQTEEEEEEEEEDYEVDQARIIREAPSLDNMAKLITVEEISPASGLVSILKKRNVYLDNLNLSDGSQSQPEKLTAKRRVRFKVPDDGYDHDVGSADSCLLLFLLCLVTVVISVGGTALYCALGDAQSSVCQDFSRNADFYFGQIQRGITQIQHWFAPGS